MCSSFKDLHRPDFSADELKRLLENHPAIDIDKPLYEKTGDTIFHIAARAGNANLLEYLLTQTTRTDHKNIDCKTPLHEACQFVRFESVAKLIEHGANVNALKKADWTPLMLACTKTGNDARKTVRNLCENGALVNTRNKDGWTALHCACRGGDVEIVSLLTPLATPDVRTNNGRTVMHIAALHGHRDVVEYLSSRSDVAAADCGGNVPLHEATCGGDVEIVKLLIEKGAKIGAVNDNGFNCLHIAASEGSLTLVQFFATRIGVDSRTKLSYTALHCAARKKRTSVIETLLGLGADASARDSNDRVYVDYLRV